MKILKAIIILTLSLSVCSCKKLFNCEDQELTIKQTYYSGNELRTDGYYLNNDSTSDIFEILILFKNGIIVKNAYGDGFSIEIIESNIKNGSFFSSQKTIKRHWGLYKITNENFRMESWKASPCSMPINEIQGEILNDTTLKFTKTTFTNTTKYNEEFKTINEVYHFKKFAKPDSSVTFFN